jgi:hypothetical protein
MDEEKTKQKRTELHDRIKRMSKEEKVAEFRHYLDSGHLLKIDVDRVMADQAAVGAPDSALDDALMRIADLAGGMFGGGPLTAQELAEALVNKPTLRRWPTHQGLRHHEPPFSLRRRRGLGG